MALAFVRFLEEVAACCNIPTLEKTILDTEGRYLTLLDKFNFLTGGQVCQQPALFFGLLTGCQVFRTPCCCSMCSYVIIIMRIYYIVYCSLFRSCQQRIPYCCCLLYSYIVTALPHLGLLFIVFIYSDIILFWYMMYCL
jgi:hypothetical protein